MRPYRRRSKPGLPKAGGGRRARTRLRRTCLPKMCDEGPVRSCSFLHLRSRFGRGRFIWSRFAGGSLAGRSLDRLADALIGSAAADVAFHRRVDVGVGRPGLLFEHRGGLHDLTALAIAALRDVGLPPCLLNGVIGLRAQAFDGHDRLPGHAPHRELAAARGGPVHVNRAGAAQPLAAAVLRTRQPQLVAQVPQQGHIRLAVELTADAIHIQFDHAFSPGVWLSSMIPDEKTSGMIWRLFGRRKTAGWMLENYPPSGGNADD